MKYESIASDVLRYDNTIWTYIVKHLFDIYEFPSFEEDKEIVLGSLPVNESVVFNPMLKSYYQDSTDNSLIINFDKLSEITNIHNRVIMLSEFDEHKLLSLYIKLKKVTSTLLLTSKDVSIRYVNALNYDWKVRSKFNVLRITIDMMDRYFGMLKWGPYWSSLDNMLTCYIFPKHVSNLKNALLQKIEWDEFDNTQFFEQAIFTLQLYNKERQILNTRKDYFCAKRANILHTFGFDISSCMDDIKSESSIKSCYENSEAYVKKYMLLKSDDMKRSTFIYALVSYRDIQ